MLLPHTRNGWKMKTTCCKNIHFFVWEVGRGECAEPAEKCQNCVSFLDSLCVCLFSLLVCWKGFQEKNPLEECWRAIFQLHSCPLESFLLVSLSAFPTRQSERQRAQGTQSPNFPLSLGPERQSEQILRPERTIMVISANLISWPLGFRYKASPLQPAQLLSEEQAHVAPRTGNTFSELLQQIPCIMNNSWF